MGRPRKNEFCPKCGDQGYLEKKSLRFVHYNSFTKKRDKKCYVAQQIWDSKNQDWILQKKNELEKMSPIDIQDFYWKLSRQNLGFDRREKKVIKEILECVAINRKIQLPIYKKESARDPPLNLQGESELYHKIGDLFEHFFKIGRNLKKIQNDIYRFKPDEKTSSECVKDLTEFETTLLMPLEKLLVPYGKKWSANWTEWINIQLDNLSLGPNHTAKLHARSTGEYGIKINKEGQTTLVEIKGSMTSKQIKKNQKKVLEFAYQIIRSHYLEKALTNWSYNTFVNEEYDKNGNLI